MQNARDTKGVKTNREYAIIELERSVASVLSSVKSLLECWVAWTSNKRGDKEVSDCFVLFGNEFNATCRCFNKLGISTSDLSNIPVMLREVLETSLSEVGSEDTLGKYLSRIRSIYAVLSNGLKQKQAEARSSKTGSPLPSRENSDEYEQYQRSVSSASSSMKSSRNSYYSHAGTDASESRQSDKRSTSKPRMPVVGESFVSKPLPKPYNPLDKVGRLDAFSALQKSSALERRGSRRFSAYQESKFATPMPRYASAEKRFAVMEPPPKVEPIEHRAATVKPHPKAESIETLPSQLTLFLQLGRSTKKVTVENGVTLSQLQLLFMEKFSFSPGNNDLPSIKLQDPTTGIRYDLENCRDLKPNSLLCLDIEEFDHVKMYFESHMELLTELLGNIKGTLKDQVEASQLISDAQLKTNRAISDLQDNMSDGSDASKTLLDQKYYSSELAHLNRDLKEIGIAFDELQGFYEDSMIEVAKKITEMKHDLKLGVSDEYVETSRAQIDAAAETLVAEVDDVQDAVEVLRKDVAQRGIRPLGKTLKSINRQINDVKLRLKEREDHLVAEKPIWKRIWERQLESICEEQQFFNLQEELVKDLCEDLNKVVETFGLVEDCSHEQSRKVSNHHKLPSVNFADKSALLSELMSVKPDHAGRVEAIEKAERDIAKRTEERIEALEKESDVVTDVITDVPTKRASMPVQNDSLKSKPITAVSRNSMYSLSPSLLPDISGDFFAK